MTADSTSTINTKHPNKVPIRSTSARDSSVYDRLYKANTASSKVRKEIAPVKSKNILTRENEAPLEKPKQTKVRAVNRRPKKAITKSTDGAVFSRLYAKGTASSVSKRSEGETGNKAVRALKPKN